MSSSISMPSAAKPFRLTGRRRLVEAFHQMVISWRGRRSKATGPVKRPFLGGEPLMTLKRREFLLGTAAALAAGASGWRPAFAADANLRQILWGSQERANRTYKTF